MDFYDAMIELNNGNKVTRKSFLNCYWEKAGEDLYREKFTGPAACAGSTCFKYNNISEREKEAMDWGIYND